MSIKVRALKKHPYGRKQRKKGDEYFIENPKIARLLVHAKKIELVTVKVELDNSEVKRRIDVKVKEEIKKELKSVNKEIKKVKKEKKEEKPRKKRVYGRKDLTAEETTEFKTVKGKKKDEKTIED